EPARRYPSAAELAEDLRRWQAGEPIKARPVGRVERVARWCRRNPWVAGLSAAVLLLLTVTAIGGGGGVGRVGRLSGPASAALRRAEDAGRGAAAAVRKAQAEERKAQAEERAGRRKLFESSLAEADAIRMSRRPGQRFNSLARLREALEVGRKIGLSPEDRV